jgi:hypothetical protein
MSLVPVAYRLQLNIPEIDMAQPSVTGHKTQDFQFIN